MTTILIILLALSGFLGLLMELYKKTLRRDKAKEWEIRGVALLLSAFLGFVLYKVTDPAFLPDGVYFTPWITVVFTILIYILQLPACMKVWKPIVKDIIERKSKDA